MSELGVAYWRARAAGGAASSKLDQELLTLRKQVKDFEAEKASFHKRMAELVDLVEELKEARADSPAPYLSDPVARTSRRISKEEILEAVIEHFGITRTEILGPTQFRRVTRPRQIAVFLCTKHTDWSMVAIAKYFGGRDHTTAIHARNAIAARVAADPETANHVREIERDLGVST